MRIRIHGTEAECRRTADRLAQVLDVLDVSRPYPDRPPSRLVRLYLTVNPSAEKE
ncbi:hypothetical protein I5Q34_08105 [Streptomyces sp. AV19]|uniref:hypothetical protein n=1 Tax=Streptomyces sp. AV19 TaxID=2793068 RepID=UPI0018FE7C5D|nr:hypothetical protein [Streptomyces sp. AV19]MBH1934258.1 hypothetical protein [Streptomyces sp. AV19]MDG4533434.1 hypothetical protein [Streptomyces sp. AV19]